MLLTMSGQVLKTSSTLLLRRALFLTPVTFCRLLPSAWKLPLATADFSSPDSLNKHVGSLGCVSESSNSRPLRLQSYDSPRYVYVWLCFIVVCFFFFLYFFSSPQWQHAWLQHEREWKKATSQISPLKWYVLAGEIYFSGVLLCCNQREWRSDCDSHHQRLMANQTGGLPNPPRRSRACPALSPSLSSLFIQEIQASH